MADVVDVCYGSVEGIGSLDVGYNHEFNVRDARGIFPLKELCLCLRPDRTADSITFGQ